MEPNRENLEQNQKTEYKEEAISKKLAFKEKVIDQFQKMTVDRLVNQSMEPTDSNMDDLLWMFEDDTPEEQQAFAEEIKEKAEIEEVDLGLVSLIKCEVLKDIESVQKEKLQIYDELQTVTTDTYVKIQMWSYFPIIGSVIYLLMLLAITVDPKGKYNTSLRNWAKAQLKFYWIYALVTLVIVFVAIASGISFINIIQRGLRA